MGSAVEVNDNPQSPSYPALPFLSRQIQPNQGGNPFNVPVTWYGRPLGSEFDSPYSPKDIKQYNLSQTINTNICLLYTSPSPRDMRRSRMPSSA